MKIFRKWNKNEKSTNSSLKEKNLKIYKIKRKIKRKNSGKFLKLMKKKQGGKIKEKSRK